MTGASGDPPSESQRPPTTTRLLALALALGAGLGWVLAASAVDARCTYTPEIPRRIDAPPSLQVDQ